MSIIKNIIATQTTQRREVEDLTWTLETPIPIDGPEPDSLRAICHKNFVTFILYERNGMVQGSWGRSGPRDNLFSTIAEAKAAANTFRRAQLGLDAPVEIPVQLSLPALAEWKNGSVNTQSFCRVTNTLFEVTKTDKGFVAIAGMPVMWEAEPVSSVEEAKQVIEGWRHEIVLPHITVSPVPEAPAVDDGVVWHTAKGEAMTFADIGDRHLENILNMLNTRKGHAEYDLSRAKGISTIINREKIAELTAQITMFEAEGERRAQLAHPGMTPV